MNYSGISVKIEKKKENRNLSIMAKLKRQSGETYKCNVFVHYFLQTNLDETLPRINFFLKRFYIYWLLVASIFVPAFRPDSVCD